MHILLIDDDVGSLRGMKAALQMLKHTCDGYNDPAEAVRHYRDQVYDLVITDVGMPFMDGFALAKQLKEINPQVKVLFMSGQALARTTEVEAAIEQKCFLQKPIDFLVLKNRLEQIRSIVKMKNEGEIHDGKRS